MDKNKINAVNSNLQYPFDNDCAFADSAATDNYAQSSAPVEQVKPMSNPEPMYFTNGLTMRGSHECVLLNLSLINIRNKTAQIFLDSSNTTLLSVCKLCDEDCIDL